MKRITLDQLAPGESGRIKKVHGKGAVRRRLMDMGLTSGVVIDMVKNSPLGDPVEYRLRGYHLSLRRSEAEDWTGSWRRPCPERGSWWSHHLPAAPSSRHREPQAYPCRCSWPIPRRPRGGCRSRPDRPGSSRGSWLGSPAGRSTPN